MKKIKIQMKKLKEEKICQQNLSKWNIQLKSWIKNLNKRLMTNSL